VSNVSDFHIYDVTALYFIDYCGLEIDPEVVKSVLRTSSFHYGWSSNSFSYQG
jgi:hypothetical protein